MFDQQETAPDALKNTAVAFALYESSPSFFIGSFWVGSACFVATVAAFFLSASWPGLAISLLFSNGPGGL